MRKSKKIRLLNIQIEKLPRLILANLPTPLQEMSNLSERLEGPKIFIKRDDQTGLAFGGNKTRKLEFLMADAKEKEADVVVAGILGFQSNFLTQTAAAAKKVGMDVVLVKIGPKDKCDSKEYDGNHLLQFLLEAEIRASCSWDNSILQTISEELEEKNRKPYIIPYAGSTPLGTIGYVNAMIELSKQIIEKSLKIDYIIHATGSGGTQAGLVVGAKALDSNIKVLGVSVSKESKTISEGVLKLANDSAQLLNLDLTIWNKDVSVLRGYAKDGYGVIDEGKVEAIKLTAQTEGIFLDPVYTGSAMAGLIDLIQRGFFDKNDQIVFIHTGGTPALFPYKEPIRSFIMSREFSWRIPPWSIT
jgi:D-cysteine desulfhydrase family pyridoxal phosphate-dependent enzyme